MESVIATSSETLFNDFPTEMGLVGRMLTQYSVIELVLLKCVRAAGVELDVAFRILYGARGETQRVTMAKALAHAHYVKLGLEGDFDKAMKAVKWCLKARNQYAHSLWRSPGGKQLGFAGLEEAAKKNTRVTKIEKIKLYPLNLPLLQQQADYFTYTEKLLNWMGLEALVKQGAKGAVSAAKPATLVEPVLHLPRP